MSELVLYMGLEELNESCDIVLILAAVSLEVLTDHTIAFSTH